MEDTYEQEAMASGMDHFVTKPITGKKLKEVLERAQYKWV